ncbi:MAG: VanZ family protein [Deltaproteobacteria bacterium]|nr:MAG: VanZ family protein [Deltaproteobacteria bacterium]
MNIRGITEINGGTTCASPDIMHPFKYPKLWLGLGWTFFALVVFLSLWPKLPGVLSFNPGDKIGHLVTYMTLMLWFANMYPQRNHHLLLAGAFLGMGMGLELIQGMSGYRTFAYMDIVANGLGILLGLWLAETRLATCLFYLDTWLPPLSQ